MHGLKGRVVTIEDSYYEADRMEIALEAEELIYFKIIIDKTDRFKKQCYEALYGFYLMLLMVILPRLYDLDRLEYFIYAVACLCVTSIFVIMEGYFKSESHTPDMLMPSLWAIICSIPLVVIVHKDEIMNIVNKMI